MGNKKGHRQFGTLRHDIFNTAQHFEGYPHRRHKKNRLSCQQSEIKRIRDSAHIEVLEEEIKEYI